MNHMNDHATVEISRSDPSDGVLAGQLLKTCTGCSLGCDAVHMTIQASG